MLTQVQYQLNEAMNNDELTMVYQPIVNIDDGELKGVEALVRWHHHKSGWISPQRFISVAERTGQIHVLGEYILGKVCQDIKRWEEMGFEPVPVAINISVKQLEKPNFGALVRDILSHYNVKIRYMEFEITESIAAGDMKTIQENILDIKKLGIKISMDDFGTRYSSLVMLLNLQVDKLKIDKIFIDHIRKERDKKIIMTVLKMAEELGLQVIAEGVETKKQVEFLKRLNCKYAQGYFWARPMAAENLINYLKPVENS